MAAAAAAATAAAGDARLPLTLFNTQMVNTLKLFVLQHAERFGTCVAGCTAANLHLPPHLFAFQDSAAHVPLHLSVEPFRSLDGVLRALVHACRDEAERLGCGSRRIIGFRHLATPEGVDIPGCRLLYLDGLAIAHVFVDNCCAILRSNSPNGFALRDLVTSVDEPVWCVTLRDVFRQLSDPLRYGIPPLDAACMLQRCISLRLTPEDGSAVPPPPPVEGDPEEPPPAEGDPDEPPATEEGGGGEEEGGGEKEEGGSADEEGDNGGEEEGGGGDGGTLAAGDDADKVIP